MAMTVSVSERTRLAEKVGELQRLRDNIRALHASACGITPAMRERHDKLWIEVLSGAVQDSTAKVDFQVFGPNGILAWAMAMKRAGVAA